MDKNEFFENKLVEEKTQNTLKNLENIDKNANIEVNPAKISNAIKSENFEKINLEEKQIEEDLTVKWTDEQLDAITDRNKNLLISASAGSGKTTVMTQRIIDLVYKNEIPITKFLIVTFTSASAQDMKAKIVEKLMSLPQTEFVLNQIDNVSTSDISDLHSFYSKLIATYFYEIQIDPNYHIIDDTESTYLKERAITRVFENMEKQDNASYFRLFDIFQKGRKDANLKESVFKLSNFLASHIDGDKWFKDNIEKSYNDDIETNICAIALKNYFKEMVADFIERANNFINICGECEKYYNLFVDLVFRLRAFLKDNSFQKFAELFLEFKFESLPKVKDEYKHFSSEAKKLNDYIKNRFADYGKYITTSDLNLISLQIKNTKNDLLMLFDLTKQYEKVYETLKKDKGGLDFNDLERYALKILSNQSICDAVKSKYEYVFVDEYQDINEVQEKIISMVSSENNRFMVGDLKQSIYRFRLCDPEIFLDKYNSYEKDSEKSKVIKLNCNFRSDKKILRFADEVFSRFMTKKFGGIDYEKDSMFVPGEKNIDEAESVNLCLIDTGEKVDEEFLKDSIYSVKNHNEVDTEDVKGCIAEARYIAQKVAEIFEMEEKQGNEISFSDFAILVFARKNNKITRMIDELKRLGLPITSESKDNIIERPHIQEIINFVRYCFNDRDDYLTFKVLKSKLFKFSDDEIVQIRKIDLSVNFYETIKLFEEIQDEKLKEKVGNFFEKVNKFKKLSRISNIKDFCKSIIAEFKLEKLNLINQDGRIFNEDIDKFISELPSVSTIEFLVTHENLSISGNSDSGEDSIQLMTVHKSKGMEFKYVFVVNTSGEINYKSLNESLIMNKNFMVGMNYFDSVSKIEMPTIPMGICKIVEKRKIAEEQLRVFYVALTRAKKKLFVLCSKNADSLNSEIKNLPIAYSDWLSPIILDIMEDNNSGRYSYINFEKIDVNEFITSFEAKEKELILSKIDVEQISQLEYKFQPSINIPLKNSVSKILKYRDDVVNQDLIEEDFDDNYEIEQEYLNNEFYASSAERGTAYHNFLQLIDFSNNDNLMDQVDFLYKDYKEKDLIDVNLCKNILSNEFFKNLSNMKVLKEREFFAEVPANLLDKNAHTNDKIIMQGIIDLCAISENDVFVLDYKTGKFSDEKLQKYKFQLDVYSDICEKAINRKVTGKFICFIDEQKFVKI